MPEPSCRRRLRFFADMDSLSHAVARAMVGVAQEAVHSQGHCRVALAGGSTPRWLYELLATRYRADMPWGGMRWFFGDERYVPPGDPQSNYQMAKAAMLDRVRVPGDRVHPMPTGYADPRQAAAAYEAALREIFPGAWPRFDLVLLGLGEDGHVASLFPGAAVLAEERLWVAPSLAPGEPHRRLTLTYPVLNHAARTWFLVSGASKARALRLALRADTEPTLIPAAGIRPVDGELVWWADEAAAAELRYPPTEDRP
jgi:6-phosphogluconolactonase